METLTKQFESRVTGFLERTRLKPSMFGLRATGDPNLMRQLRLGRSPTLAVADRILAFIDAYDRAHAEEGPARRRPREDAAVRSRDIEAARPVDHDREAPVLILRLPAVQARTGLSRSTICARAAQGSFPEPVCVVGWIQGEVDAWIRRRDDPSRGGTQGPARPPAS